MMMMSLIITVLHAILCLFVGHACCSGLRLPLKEKVCGCLTCCEFVDNGDGSDVDDGDCNDQVGDGSLVLMVTITMLTLMWIMAAMLLILFLSGVEDPALCDAARVTMCRWSWWRSSGHGGRCGGCITTRYGPANRV